MRNKLFKTSGSDVDTARGFCNVEMCLVWGSGDIAKEAGNLSWCHLLGWTMDNRGVQAHHVRQVIVDKWGYI